MSLAEIRWRRHRRAERLTRSGFLFFLAIVGIGAVAINSGNNLLYLVFSTLLSALIFSGLLSVANMRRIGISIDVADDVYAGHPARLIVTIRNTGSFPLFFATIVLRVGCGSHTLSVPFVGSHAAMEFPLTATLRSRGRLAGLWAEIASTFPFGIVQMLRQVPVAGDLVVYPRVRPVRLRQENERGDYRLEKARAGGDGDFFSLRAYHEGDDARRIDWKVSARRGEPYVVEQEARYQQETLFYIDTARNAWPDAEAFEQGVSKIASGVTSVFRSGGAVALAMPGSFVEGRDRRAWQKAMELLALVEMADGQPHTAPAHSVTHEALSFTESVS